jgi:hypothetical protein
LASEAKKLVPASKGSRLITFLQIVADVIAIGPASWASTGVGPAMINDPIAMAIAKNRTNFFI